LGVSAEGGMGRKKKNGRRLSKDIVILGAKIDG